MQPEELEMKLLRMSHDGEVTELAGGFKGHHIISADGVDVYALPKTILKAAKHTGKPLTYSGIVYAVVEQGSSDLEHRESTYGDFIEKYKNLFLNNSVDFNEVNDPFAALLARL